MSRWVRITDANFGMLLIQNPSGNKYALTAGGTAELVGFDGILELSGSLAVKVNKTGIALNETISLGATTVDVVFADGADVMGFYGDVSLQIVDFVKISGAFGFEVQVSGTTTKLLIGAANVSAFLGVGAGTPDAIGIQVKDAKLGLVLFKTGTAASTYALDASGTAALVGLDGLVIVGTLGVRVNKTGQTVDETVHTSTTSAGDVLVKFDTTENIQAFSGSITLSVTGVFTLSGSVTATQRANGTVLIDIPNVTLTITLSGNEVFSISASARFSISPIDGFRLVDMRVIGFKVFGVGANATPSPASAAIGIFNVGLERVVRAPGSAPYAILENPLADSSIDARTLNLRKYIDVTFNDYSGLGLDIASITDSALEFTLSGAGVGDAEISSIQHLKETTYRYHLTDSNPGNTTDLFREGIVNIQFSGGGWYDLSGKANAAKTETVTVVDGRGAGTTTLSLGPLSLEGPSVGIEDFQFLILKDAGGNILGPRLLIMVGIGVAQAALNFGGGQSGSGVKAELNGLMGAFEIALDWDINNLFAFQMSASPENSRSMWILC